MKNNDFDRTLLLKYKGKFAGLSKRGYEFRRVFARNYMMWINEGEERHDSNEIVIWKHLGGYIELNGLNAVLSKVLARVICTPDLLESFERVSYLRPGWKVYEFLIDNDTREVVKFDRNTHDSIWVFSDRIKANEEGIDAVINDWEMNFEKKYRKVIIGGHSWVIPKVREMYAAGEINPFE